MKLMFFRQKKFPQEQDHFDESVVDLHELEQGSKKQKNTFQYGCFLVFFLLFFLILAHFLDWQKMFQPSLQTSFFSVGQGDAAHVRTPSGTDVLIDGGPDHTVLFELGRSMPFWDRDLEYVVATHFDADHITGLVQVLRRYQVHTVFAPELSGTTPEYLAFISEAKKQNIAISFLHDPISVDLKDHVQMEIFARDASNAGDQPNNFSLLTKIDFAGRSLLFTGDMEKPAEEFWLARHVALSADVVKIAHHGSKSSSSEAFLQAVHPSIAVISVGKDNRYGHPHREVLEQLEKPGISILRTDLNGTIRINVFQNGEYEVAHP